MSHPVMHFEIPANDVERLKEFYAELFGWGMTTGAEMPGYVMVETRTDGQGIDGGIMKKQDAQQKPVNYVMVESVSQYSDKAKELGGTVVMAKTPIPKMGYFAVCLDPEGNPVGLFEADKDAA